MIFDGEGRSAPIYPLIRPCGAPSPRRRLVGVGAYDDPKQKPVLDAPAFVMPSRGEIWDSPCFDDSIEHFRRGSVSPLTFAAMNLKKLAKWSWKDKRISLISCIISFIYPQYMPNPCLAYEQNRGFLRAEAGAGCTCFLGEILLSVGMN